jgi:hypothetical protein
VKALLEKVMQCFEIFIPSYVMPYLENEMYGARIIAYMV